MNTTVWPPASVLVVFISLPQYFKNVNHKAYGKVPNSTPHFCAYCTKILIIYIFWKHCYCFIYELYSFLKLFFVLCILRELLKVLFVALYVLDTLWLLFRGYIILLCFLLYTSFKSSSLVFCSQFLYDVWYHKVFWLLFWELVLLNIFVVFLH